MLTRIALENLVPHFNQVRKKFEDETIDDNKQYQTIEGLAQNISEVGLINPLTVKNVGGDTYRIISGERRYRACKSLGWTEIPCIVVEATPEQVDWIMLSENMQRKDLSEVEKAEALNSMRSHSALSNREFAKRIGVSEKYIRNLFKIHGLPEEIKEEIKEKNISGDTATVLSKLDTPTEQIKVAKEIKEKDLNKKEVEQIVDFVKTAPEPIKEKLNTEPEYTIEQAKREVFEVEIITPNEYLDSEITFKETRGIIEKCVNLLKETAISIWQPMDKVKLKQDLQFLKARIDKILMVIDTL